MIDNIEFVKFVLANRSMSEEEKMDFLEAAPKMTEAERAEIVLLVLTEQTAGIVDDLGEKEIEAALAGKDVDEVVDAFLESQGKQVDDEKIEQIKEKLKVLGSQKTS